METSKFRRHALVPKTPLRTRPTSFVPIANELELGSFIQKLTPSERLALREIVAGADVIEVDGCKFLLAPIEPETLDVLAAFEADLEDLEFQHEDEVEEDDDRDNDNPADPAGVESDDEDDGWRERQRFIRARADAVEVWYHPAPILQPKNDGHDRDEIRKARRFLDTVERKGGGR